MRSQSILIPICMVWLGLSVGGCKSDDGKPSTAIETNVYRCVSDAGPCDAGAGPSADAGDIICKTDDDCPKGSNCGQDLLCGPAVSVR